MKAEEFMGLNLKQYKYISMIVGTPEFSYYVRNNNDESLLGYIAYERNWKQFCFFPIGETQFSEKCLEDIVDFIRKKNKGEK
jgi:hypothetical protein